MKTIKQIADELGVSKDKVKYQAGKLPRETVVKNQGITHINDKGIAILRDILLSKPTGKLPGELPSELPTDFPGNNNAFIKLLEKNLNVLQEQIIEKDRQLTEKDKQISTLTETIKIQAQSLNAINHNELAETLQLKLDEKNAELNENLNSKNYSFIQRIFKNKNRYK